MGSLWSYQGYEAVWGYLASKIPTDLARETMMLAETQASQKRVNCGLDNVGPQGGFQLRWTNSCVSAFEWVWVRSLSPVQLFATSWTVAYQAPPSVGFSRQEYWSGVPSPSLPMKGTQVQYLVRELRFHLQLFYWAHVTTKDPECMPQLRPNTARFSKKREREQNQHGVHEKIQWGTTTTKKADALLEGLKEEQATDNHPLLHQ